MYALGDVTGNHGNCFSIQLLCIPDKGMEDWDEQKLEEVVNQKHGELNKGMPATTIVSLGYSHRHGDLYIDGRIVLY